MVCDEVDDYIDKIVKELSLPPLVVGNQILSHDWLMEKWKDDHLKRMVEIRLENLIVGMVVRFVASPTKATTRLQYSMVHIQFRLKQLMAWKHNCYAL